ncbi:hypothetical protein V6N13_018342 [Hibiscus sabdariffa]
MSCDTSDRQVLGTRIFKFTVAGVVKDGRVGCGGVLYAASGIIRGMFSGLKIWSDLNLAALFTIKSELKLFSVTMWAGGQIGRRRDGVLVLDEICSLLLRFKLVEGRVSVMEGGFEMWDILNS